MSVYQSQPCSAGMNTPSGNGSGSEAASRLRLNPSASTYGCEGAAPILMAKFALPNDGVPDVPASAAPQPRPNGESAPVVCRAQARTSSGEAARFSSRNSSMSQVDDGSPCAPMRKPGDGGTFAPEPVGIAGSATPSTYHVAVARPVSTTSAR